MATNTNYLQALTLVVNQQISISAIRGISPTTRIAGNVTPDVPQIVVNNATRNSININRITDFQFSTNVQVNQGTQYSGPNFNRQIPLQNYVASINVSASPSTTRSYNTFDNKSVALNYSGLTFTVTNYTAQPFTLPGSYSWTVPSGVSSINVAAIGAGGGGVFKITGGDGGGGGLSNYENNISVNPGDSYTIVVGTGGISGNARGVAGGDTYMYPSSGVPIITAGGGAGGSNMFWQYPDRVLINEDVTGIFSNQPAIDPANGTVGYSVSSGSLPSDMTLNPSTGVLTWTESRLATTGTSNTSTIYGPITLSATNGSITVTKPVYIVVNSNPIDTYFTATQIALAMDNTATTFIRDVSIYNNQGVASGFAVPSMKNPFNGSYYSALFDGSTGFITLPSGILDVGSQSFGVEFWWQPLVTTRQSFFSSNADFWLMLDYNTAGGRLGLYASTNGTSWDLITGASGGNGQASGFPNLGQWNHIALSRSVGSWSVWLNGVRVLVLTGLSNTIISRINEPKIIGASTSAASNKVNGWMTGFKFVVGTALYDPTLTTITVPTAPITSSVNTKLLILQEPWFYDKTGTYSTATVSGTVTLTPFHPYNNANANANAIVNNSAYFGAVGADYVAYQNQPAVPLIGPGDFTVEAWIYPISRAATMPVIINTYDVSQSGSFALYAGHATPGLTKWSALIGSGTPNLVSNVNINFLQWSHVAISKIGNIATFYINGLIDASISTTGTTTINGMGPYVVIGNAWDSSTAGASALFFNGYISNLRTVNGIGLYTGNFAVPTAPFSITQASSSNVQAITTNTSTTLLTLQNIGPVNNLSLLDNSDYKNIITRGAGSPGIGSMNPYRQYSSSTYFNGVSANFVGTATVNTAFALSTGDFTIEAWVFPTNLPANGSGTVFDLRTAAGATAIVGRFNASGRMQIDGAVSITFTNELITMGNWNHVAWSRVNGVLYGYINGKIAGQSGYTSDLGSVSQPLYIGYNWTAAFGWYGFISNFRIIKGFGIYNSNYFVPQTTPLTTTQSSRLGVRAMNTASYTSVLTLQNGYTDNSTSNLLMSVGGTPSSDWQSPFVLTSPYPSYTPSEGGSVFLTGATTDYFLISNAPGLVLSTNTATASTISTWTIECWVRPLGLYTANNIIYSKRSAAGTGSYEGGLSITTGSVYFSYNAVLFVSPFSPRAGVWTHVAWAYNGTAGTFKMYANGAMIYNVASSTVPITEVNTNLRIGANFTPAMYYYGWISDLRIVKGIAVYDTTAPATFTPPTSKLNITQLASTNIAAISNSVNTTLLLNFNSSAIYDLAAKNNIISIGNAQRTSVNYKYGNSSALFPYVAPTGTGGQTITDYFRTPLSANGVPGSSILAGNFTLEYWFNSSGNRPGNYTAVSTYVQRLQIHYDCRTAIANNTGFAIGSNELGQITLFIGTSIILTSYTPCLPNSWNHVALVRYNTVITMYINGIPQGSITSNAIFNDNQSIIGINYGDLLQNMDGYIDELRITKLARYTSSFTPPYRIKGK